MLGAIIGDVVGSVYEFNNIKTKDFPLIDNKSNPTDDSIMTFAVAECIQKGVYDDPEQIVNIFKKWGNRYPYAGYGGRFFHWLFTDRTEPYNSFGNGAAMRISAAGWYGRNEEEVKELAYNLTAVTHNHPEGLKGAEVTAMCIYYARIGKSKEFIKEYVSQYYDIDFDYEELRRTYTFNETCQNSVPQAIYCFLISTDFEDCLRTTISIGGDCDTTAAISCAIAEAYYKDIDVDIIKKTLEILKEYDIDGNIFKIINNFLNYKACSLVNSEDINLKTTLVGIEEKVNSKTVISFVHSSILKPLVEYITWLNNRDKENNFNTCDYYLNLTDDNRKVMEIKEIDLFRYMLSKTSSEDIKYILFRNYEEAVNYLNENYDLNNEHLNNIFEREYCK